MLQESYEINNNVSFDLFPVLYELEMLIWNWVPVYI